MTILSFYEKPALLDRNHHRNMRLKASSRGYYFAAASIAIPVAPIEFVQAAIEFPIVFAVQEKGSGTPIVLLGVRENENLLINAEGKWLGSYIPAFIRRYPFVLNIDPETSAPAVLVDEAFDGFNAAEGDRLFEEDGSETALLKSTLAFLGDFKAQSDFSNQFMEQLKKYDLLVPQQVVFNRGPGQSFSLDGFYIVDEKRLAGLSDAAILELARSGDLGRIHAHLLSLSNVNKLVQRLSEKLPPVAAQATA